MEFYDGGQDDEFDDVAVEREDDVAPRWRLTPGWALVVLGLALQTLFFVGQAARFGGLGGFGGFFLLTNIAMLLGGAVMTAGLVLVVLRRWFLPDLVASLRADVEARGAEEPPGH